jgi:hypothetical protein
MKTKTTMWMSTLALAAVLLPSPMAGQTAEDRAGVERAAMNYLEGFYEGDADKIRAGVHPEVVKVGYFAGQDGEYRRAPMSFEEMIRFADRVKAEGEFPAEDAPKEAEILEVLDKVAAAKVVAWWGVDYLHLVKLEGEWKILHVIWQSPPRG